MSYMVAVERQRREACSRHTLPSALCRFNRAPVRLQETHLIKETDIERDQESVAQNGTQGQQEKAANYVIQTVTSLDQVWSKTEECHIRDLCSEVSPEEWNACLTSSCEENPFLLYEFLSALEHSGCTVCHSLLSSHSSVRPIIW